MRSSDEHYNNILEKMEKKRGERMMRKKYVMGAVSCLAVVLVAGVVISQTDLFNKQENSDAQYAKDTDLEWAANMDGGDYGDDGADSGEDGAEYWVDNGEDESEYWSEESATDDAGEDVDIADVDIEPGIKYYIPNSDGTYTVKQDWLLVEENGETYREDIPLNSAVIRYLELCRENGYAEGVTLDTVETETVEGTEESNGDGMVSYKVGYATASIYLEGDAIENETLIGLVNSIVESPVIAEAYYRYVKVYLNGEAVSINGECPEQGFEGFDIEVLTY